MAVWQGIKDLAWFYSNLLGSLATPDVEGIYETQVSLDFRALLQLGCMCGVVKGYQNLGGDGSSFNLEQLQARGLEAGDQLYLAAGNLHALCLCIMRAPLPSPRALLALLMPPSKRAMFIAVDSVRTNQMPNIQALFTAERNAR
jgi:DNA polymerase epsilon subunit 1